MTGTASRTGIELLGEVAEALDLAGSACESPEDSLHYSELADRVRIYLATSRPTTPLGMPQILSSPNRLDDEMVIHRTTTSQSSHIRIVSD